MSWIRKRLDREDGISLVEMLVSIMILTVALFALLGTLIASAASIVDQQSRSRATRVATEYLESLRRAGFASVLERDADGDFDSAAEIVVEGQSFLVSTDVEEFDAATGGAPVSGQPTVIEITSSVEWDFRGQTRTSAFTTAVAPEAGDLAAGMPGIQSVNINPNPSVVDPDGHPTEDLEVTVILQGFDDDAYVWVSWVNDGPSTGITVLTSSDGGVTWSGVIDKDVVTKAVDPGLQGNLDFTVEADGITTLYTLPLAGQLPEGAPQILSTSLPSSIGVENHQGNCSGNGQCVNQSTVNFSATVSGLDPTQDTVRLKYQRVDGTYQEIAMVYDGDPDAYAGEDPTEWTHTAAQGSEKFKVGAAQAFVFTALRVDEAAPHTVERTVNVFESGS